MNDTEVFLTGALISGALAGPPLAAGAGAWFFRSPVGAALCAFLTPFFALPLWLWCHLRVQAWLCGPVHLRIGYWEKTGPDPTPNCPPILEDLQFVPLFLLLCAAVAAPILVYRRKVLALVSAGHQPPDSLLGSFLAPDNHPTSSDERMEE